VNNNDTCMHLFVNPLNEKVFVNLFDLPPKYFYTWAELCYWFSLTNGQRQIPSDWIKDYNSLTYPPGDSIKTFNLRFTKLYNRVLDVIRPQNQETLIHYYNILLPSYRHILEERGVVDLSLFLLDCLEYEERTLRN
jgi:hypothetical protein